MRNKSLRSSVQVQIPCSTGRFGVGQELHGDPGIALPFQQADVVGGHRKAYAVAVFGGATGRAREAAGGAIVEGGQVEGPAVDLA